MPYTKSLQTLSRIYADVVFATPHIHCRLVVSPFIGIELGASEAGEKCDVVWRRLESLSALIHESDFV